MRQFISLESVDIQCGIQLSKHMHIIPFKTFCGIQEVYLELENKTQDVQ